MSYLQEFINKTIENEQKAQNKIFDLLWEGKISVDEWDELHEALLSGVILANLVKKETRQ